MIIEESRNGIILKGVECLSLPLTLDCGEAFRWAEQEDGSWSGAAYGKYLNIKEENGNFILKDTSLEDFENVWRNYFDLDRDYAAICAKLKEDELVRETIDEYYGIRILNQEPWEALVSFVISQQNNIKRIKGIIKRLCDTYGEKICDGWHAFPTSKTLSKLSVEDFEALGLGYRAKYVKNLPMMLRAVLLTLPQLRRWILTTQKRLCFLSTEWEKRWQTALSFSAFSLYGAFPLTCG